MTDTATEPELLGRLAETHGQLVDQIARRVIGQQTAVEAVMTAIFAGGHALLVGAPGLAKTLLVSTLAETLGWQFKRIQFTPDLMPSDITGNEILIENKASGNRELQFRPGPVFTNVLLADEINRTTPKTQAALLEAMAEGHVTANGERHVLPDPFFVLATQNPIEQEGTYHLPEAQLDRFLLSITLDYPDLEEELAIATMDTRRRSSIESLLSLEDFARLSDMVAQLPVPEVAVRYAVNLVRATRPADSAERWVRDHVAWGAGPRASQHLLAAAKAYAALQGRAAVDPEMVEAVVPWVLGHRVVPSFHAIGAGIDGDAIVQHVLKHIRP